MFSKFLSVYFKIDIFSSKHKLHLPCKLFVEEDLLIIFQFIISVSPNSIRYQEYLVRAVRFFNVGFLNEWRWL